MILHASHPRSFLMLGAALAVATACGDANLGLVDPPVKSDKDPSKEQSLCDEHPELPSPVKVILLADVSGSLQFTDQPGVRFTAIRNLMQQLVAQGALVATMGFGSNVYVDPVVETPDDPLFIPASNWQEPSFLGIEDVATDLQGALEAARMHVQADMARVSADELARTRYVIILFTDGSPSPTCCIDGAVTIGALQDELGCPLEPWEQAQADAAYCGASIEMDACNDADALAAFRDNAGGVVFPVGTDSQVPDYGEGALQPLHGLAAGSNYNRIAQIEDAARLIGTLTQDGAGSVEIHPVMLSDATLPDGVKEIYGLNACRMQRTLERVAEQAHGTATLFGSSLALDFSVVDTAPLCAAP